MPFQKLESPIIQEHASGACPAKLRIQVILSLNAVLDFRRNDL